MGIDGMNSESQYPQHMTRSNAGMQGSAEMRAAHGRPSQALPRQAAQGGHATQGAQAIQGGQRPVQANRPSQQFSRAVAQNRGVQRQPSQAFRQQAAQGAQYGQHPSQALPRQAAQAGQAGQEAQRPVQGSRPSQQFSRAAAQNGSVQRQSSQAFRQQPVQGNQGSQSAQYSRQVSQAPVRSTMQSESQDAVQVEEVSAPRAARRPTRRKENRLSKGMKIAIGCCIALVCIVGGAGAFVYFNVTQSQEAAQTDRDNTAIDHADKGTGPIAVSDLPSTGRGELVAQGAFNPNDERLTVLKEKLDAYPKNIGMVIYSCDGSKALSYNSTGEFFSACTIKMAFMYYVSQQLEQGNGSLDEVMTYLPSHYHTGSGDIKYQSMYTDYTIRDLIWYLLTISDNIAYEMLRSRYGYDGQNQLMESIGSYSLMTGDALWAYDAQPRDYVAVWMYYYNYFLSDSEVAKVMYESCTNTDYNYATETLTQYNYSHKSGDNFEPLSAYNDTGILWCDHPYIYIVLSSSDLYGDYAQEENEIMEIVNELFR